MGCYNPIGNSPLTSLAETVRHKLMFDGLVGSRRR
jgi:hypothetical protein